MLAGLPWRAGCDSVSSSAGTFEGLRTDFSLDGEV